MSDLITINTNGLEETIRCAICENSMKSERGCDGSCRYDEKLFERIVQAIKDNEVQRPHGEWKEFTVSTYRGTDEFGEPKWGKGKKFICERCLRRTVIRENFCPSCGAKMQKEGEAE